MPKNFSSNCNVPWASYSIGKMYEGGDRAAGRVSVVVEVPLVAVLSICRRVSFIYVRRGATFPTSTLAVIPLFSPQLSMPYYSIFLNASTSPRNRVHSYGWRFFSLKQWGGHVAWLAAYWQYPGCSGTECQLRALLLGGSLHFTVAVLAKWFFESR